MTNINEMTKINMLIFKCLPWRIVEQVQEIVEPGHPAPLENQVYYPSSPEDTATIELRKVVAFNTSMNVLKEYAENIKSVDNILRRAWTECSTFVLLLRNFELSGRIAVTDSSNEDEHIVPNYFMRIWQNRTLEHQLNSLVVPLSILKINNIAEYEYNIPSFQAANESWLDAVCSLTEASPIIIIIYKKLLPGLRAEIDHIRRLSKQNSTILLLEDNAEQPPVDFPNVFRIEAEYNISSEAKMLIESMSKNVRLKKLDGSPPTQDHFWLNGKIRYDIYNRCDELYHQSQSWYFQAQRNASLLFIATDEMYKSLGLAIVLQDESRIARAAYSISFYLMHYANLEVYDLISDKLAQVLDANINKDMSRKISDMQLGQLLCLAYWTQYGKLGPTEQSWKALLCKGLESVCETKNHRERYIQFIIEEIKAREVMDYATASAARKAAIKAYCKMKYAGAPAIFGDAMYVAMLSSGIEIYGWRQIDLIRLIRTKNASHFLRNEIRESLDAAICSGNWEEVDVSSVLPGTEWEIWQLKKALEPKDTGNGEDIESEEVILEFLTRRYVVANKR